jgi:beta-phosphoglucomutase
MESLEIILEKAGRSYTADEKQEMAGRKNNYYRQLLESLSPANILPGVMGLLDGLRQEGVRIAVGSSSRNTPVIMGKIGLARAFDAVADGNEIVNSKPDPEVFLLAAQKLVVEPARCLVVEDALSGVAAARAAGMRVAAVGSAANSPQADFSADDLSEVTVSDLADYFIWEPIKG